MGNYKKYTDIELIDFVVKNKDTEAFSEIYNRYSNKIFNKSISLVNSHETAQDLTHDIFIKIFLQLKTFNKTAQFSTWIYSITYNFCIDYLRKNKKYISINIDEIEHESADDENVFVSQLAGITVEELNSILNKISHDEKIILLMKYQDDLSIKEIMKILSINESAVKMRLSRAKKHVIEISKQNIK